MKELIASFDPISLKDFLKLRKMAKKERLVLSCFQEGKLSFAYRLELLRMVFQAVKKIEIVDKLQQPIKYNCQDEQAIQSGKFYLVPACIRKNLIEQNAFAKEILLAHLKPKRVAHSYSVAKVCQALAHQHHLDEKKAYLMGLWHDICKDEEHQEEKMAYYYPYKQVPSWTIHGYLGAKWLKENLGIQDKDILRAIQRHARGELGKTAYDHILYIADKIEPLRNYDTSEEEQLAKQDLKKTVKLILYKQKLFLERNQDGHIKSDFNFFRNQTS
ncbi:bis(5'-nucleosyl)-tetraphosphatase (symmetrical) YqeK [Bulleidia sp. zg-1006]|uniref:bis(5'-nucleosyl)-tetraphosphatase (symmetrical) YqeK n=1 Tax=Bulleidia sp. zg-1006 TaxID=2806552 RepID=UPI00193AA668|nr:bis(5'-nucleosyl)-tetraphosphatase (symmetrical) YqeK [Bulleidia sp. zg-1006]QRG87104.1 bis(5'-nucleosyl)-tetraphosphatase (symmetrical) YqeK [Bulleidia sp. zg-1006]